MDGGQFMTKPENIDEQDMVGMNSNESLKLQLKSIDEETQAVDLTGRIDVESNGPKEMGGFSDIYQGTCNDQAKTVVGAILHVSVDRIERIISGRHQASASIHQTQSRPCAS